MNHKTLFRTAFRTLFPALLVFMGCSPAFRINDTVAVQERSPFNLKLRWEREIGAQQRGTTPIMHNGYLLLGTTQSWIYMYNAETGKRVDRMWADIPLTTPPAILYSLMFFSGVGDWNRLFAIDLNSGDRLWEKTARSMGPQILGRDSTIIFITQPGGVHRLRRADGKVIDRRELKESITHNPYIGDSLLIVGGSSIHVLDYPKLTVKNKIVLDSHVTGSIHRTDLGYMTVTEAGQIILFDTDGIIATSSTIGLTTKDIAVGAELVYAVSDSGVIHAFSADLSEELWSRDITGNDDYSSFIAPMIVDDGVLTVSYRGRCLYLDSATGNIRSELVLEKDKFKMDGLAHEGRVYIPSQKGMVYCLE